MAGVPDGWSPGLVRRWEGGVVGVAYRNTPRRLGKERDHCSITSGFGSGSSSNEKVLFKQIFNNIPPSLLEKIIYFKGFVF